MNTHTSTEKINETTDNGTAIARNKIETYYVGLDDSNNDPDIDAWVIWTETVDGEVEHYDALLDKGEVVTDPDLDAQDAVAIAHLQLKKRGVL